MKQVTLSSEMYNHRPNEWSNDETHVSIIVNDGGTEHFVDFNLDGTEDEKKRGATILGKIIYRIARNS